MINEGPLGGRGGGEDRKKPVLYGAVDRAHVSQRTGEHPKKKRTGAHLFFNEQN